MFQSGSCAVRCFDRVVLCCCLFACGNVSTLVVFLNLYVPRTRVVLVPLSSSLNGLVMLGFETMLSLFFFLRFFEILRFLFLRF